MPHYCTCQRSSCNSTLQWAICRDVCNVSCAHVCFTGVAEREAGIVPGAVGYSLQRELIAPMEQWLWAHQVAQVGARHLTQCPTFLTLHSCQPWSACAPAWLGMRKGSMCLGPTKGFTTSSRRDCAVVKPLPSWNVCVLCLVQGRLSELQSGRLAYDAERRKLVQRATAATSTHSEHAGTSLDPALAQLTEEAAAINGESHEVVAVWIAHYDLGYMSKCWGRRSGLTLSQQCAMAALRQRPLCRLVWGGW